VAAGDVVIAVSASGATPWTLGFAAAARRAGASVIGLANNPGAALFAASDVAVCLATPAELVAGSTRMGAGSAQKAALNLMSTLMAVRLGAVHDGMMVGLVADNDKLRARAAAMVATIAGVDVEASARALSAAAGAVRPAVLIARGLTPEAAATLLAETGGHLRAALATLALP
jgi:N-acetylmuramic acid 6-phosphate etherase